MKLTRFFITHPVTAIVLNTMIIIVGLLCLNNMSLREYPKVSIPALSVVASYPNASAELIETSVTNHIEDQLADIAGIDTLTSTSTAGHAYIDIKFRPGTKMSDARNDVRNAISRAQSELPRDLKTPQIETNSTTDRLPFISVAVSSNNMSYGELTHFAHLQIKNSFRSLPGVSKVEVNGQSYTMLVTLDPKKMYAFGVNTDEIYTAINSNRVSLPVGKFQNKIPATLEINLEEKSDFDNIIVKERNGFPIYLKSLASTQLTTEQDDFRIRINGKPGLVISIYKSSDATPLKTARLIKAEVEKLKKSLPESVSLNVNLDKSIFVESSLLSIESTILEAVAFVLLIVFLFLRNFRATLIPLITIPISLIGSLVFLKIFGFSINTITLLAMVLAIGLVVDDAIVVLENIARHIESGMRPFDAAVKGSQEIGFAVVAMTLTLTSVYAPIAFIEGTIGQLFSEFAVALAGSVIISGIAALTLSPMMCSVLLKHNATHMLPWIDHLLKKIEKGYEKLLHRMLDFRVLILSTMLFIVAAMAFLFTMIESETAPKEDRGLLSFFVPNIPGKSIDDLDINAKTVEKLAADIPEALGSLSFVGNWGAFIAVPLKDHHDRQRTPTDIIAATFPLLTQIPSIDVWPWSWDSALPGVESTQESTGIALAISTNKPYRQLVEETEKLRKILDTDDNFHSVRQSLNLDSPAYEIKLDHNAMSKLGITTAQVASTISTFFSYDRSIKFNINGIRYPVTIKGKSRPWNLSELYITSPSGKLISLDTFAKLMPTTMPSDLKHYQQMRSTILSATPKDGLKMGDAIAMMQKIATTHLPSDFKLDWTGTAKTYQESSASMYLLFGMAILFIYAILAIQFENFLDPFIIMLTVPLAGFGGLLSLWLFNTTINIYTQIGLVTLIGLITKHGILIVEFANQLMNTGKTISESVQKAAMLRLRPILMTTGAMVLAVIPLIYSADAGSEARHAIGVVLLGGLLVGTLFTLFILPTLYAVIKSIQHSKHADLTLSL